jgi:single-strand DNA-binding protein
MNVWNFTGHCAADAETRYSKSGDAIVSFAVAVKSGFGDNETTTWARCAMFGKRGTAVSAFIVKGQLVGVSGELSAREWSDKEGQKRTSIEVRVNDLTLLGKRDGQAPQQSAPRQQAPAQPSGFGDFDDDSIPF